MVKPYLNEVGGKVENDVSLFSGGLNTYVDKAFIDANHMPYVMNMQMYQPPMLCTRPSRQTLANKLDSLLTMNDEEVVDIWARSEDDIFFVTKSGSDRYLRRYYKYGNVLKEQSATGTLPVEDHYFFTYCQYGTNKKIYLGNESHKVCVDVSGTPGNPLSITPVSDNHYGIPCWHKGRLWLAKPSTNMIEWSKALDPDDYTTAPSGDSGEVYINTMKGAIQNIVSFDDKLIVFCEHSIHAIYGNSGDATDVDYFQVVDLNNNLGLHSQRCLTVGGGRLFFLGDDMEVYEYTGSSINIVSRPGKTRNSTLSIGGISNIFGDYRTLDLNNQAQMIASANKLYFNIGINKNMFLFVFDIYQRTWWCEDGEFTAMATLSPVSNDILLARENGDILVEFGTISYGTDDEYDFDAGEVVRKPIKYEFHTRVYGADGLDMLKTIDKVWFQARANADVYLNDIWTTVDKWKQLVGDDWPQEPVEDNYVKIGRLKYEFQVVGQPEKYRQDTYEQQVCYVEKMYGQRLNTFQIIVIGEGASKFYFMKREWRAR